MKRMLRRFFPNIYIALIFAFLYLPILVLVVFSFNRIPKSFIWAGFSLNNYVELFRGTDGRELLAALIATLKIAAIASLCATFIAVVSCLGLMYFSKKVQNLTLQFTYIPNVIPELVMGISFMLLFALMGLPKGEVTLVLAHIAFCVPFAVLSINPKLKQLDKNLAEAAQDLGATRFQAVTKVIIPEIMPGIISAILLTFTLSVDDYLISNFNVGSSLQTLPIKIYSMVKFGINPRVNSLTTILFAAVFLLLLAANIQTISKQRKHRKALYEKHREGNRDRNKRR